MNLGSTMPPPAAIDTPLQAPYIPAMRKFEISAALLLTALTMLSGLAAAQEAAPTEPEPAPTAAPPQGYSWVNCHDDRISLLRPAGWYFKEDSKGDTLACFLSKENIKQTERYETGLSVNILTSFIGRYRVTPSKYSEDYLKKASEDGAKRGWRLLDTWESENGQFKVRGLRYSTEVEKSGSETVVYQLLISSDSGDVLYVILLEAPKAEWDTAWLIAEPIMKNLVLKQG